MATNGVNASRVNVDEIDIDDDDTIDFCTLKTARDLIRKRGIEKLHECKVLQDYRNMIKLHNAKKKEQTKDRTAKILGKLHFEEDLRRINLYGICEQVKTFTETLRTDNPQVYKYVNKLLPDHAKSLKELDNYMSPDANCPILILGESSAGKTSFINLLLGEKVLPSHHLSNTSVICEIYYKATHRAVLYPWDDGGDRVTITENDLQCKGTGSRELIRKEFEEKLAKYIQDKTDREKWKYKRAQIYLPCAILQGEASGLTIVDSPGIGENQELNDLVVEYMLKSFAFIYVLDSAHEGGIQTDRIAALLTTFDKARRLNTDTHFFPRSAMFICNKWDLVKSKNDRDAVTKANIGKLTNLWGGFNESQMYEMSTLEALYMMEHGYISNRFMAILEGLKSVIPMGSEARTAYAHGYYTDLVKKVIDGCSVFISNYTVSKEMEMGLKKLEKDANRAYATLKQSLKETKSNVAREIKNHFETDVVKKSCCTWGTSDFSQQMTWDNFEFTVRQRTQERVVKAFGLFEETYACFKNSRESLMDDMHMHYTVLMSNLSTIKDSLVVTDVSTVEKVTTDKEDEEDPKADERNSTDEQNPNANQGNAKGGDQKWLGRLVNVVCEYLLPFTWNLRSYLALSNPGIVLAKRSNWPSHYRDPKGNDMAELAIRYSQDLLGDFLREKVLKFVAKKQLAVAYDRLEELKVSEHEKRAAVVCLLDQLREDQKYERDCTAHTAVFDKYSEVLKELNWFSAAWMFKYDLRSRKMKETEKPFEGLSCDETQVVCSGFKAAIHHGSFTDANVTKAISVRRTVNPISPQNVADYTREEGMYRRANGDNNILKLIAVTKSKGQVFQMFEALECNLREHVRQKKSEIGDGAEWEAFRKEAGLSVTRGLKYLHRMQYVHYDLSMDTIAVTAAGQVKLTNISCPGPFGNRTWSTRQEILQQQLRLHPTARYLPPELVLGNNAEYNANSDIYSLGVLLWELSTCSPAFADVITDDMPGSRFFSILSQSGVIVSLFMDRYDIGAVWSSVITKCVSTVGRENASTIYDRLQFDNVPT